MKTSIKNSKLLFGIHLYLKLQNYSDSLYRTGQNKKSKIVNHLARHVLEAYEKEIRE